MRFIEENGGRSKVYDFGRLPVEPGLARWLAGVFANRTGPRSGVKRIATAESLFLVVRLFAEVVADSAKPVCGPQELTAAHVTAFRMRHAALRSGWQYLVTLRSALRDAPEVPGEVRAALLSARRPDRGRDEPAGIVAYRDDEAQLIMSALRRDVRVARDRIRAGRDLLTRFRSGQLEAGSEQERTGRLLEVFDRSGDVPRYRNGVVLAEVRRAGGVAGLGSRLCLTLHEVTAFALLLTALTGQNFGTVASWPVAHYRPDGGRGAAEVALVEQVKPRRGPEREHMVVALEDIPASLAQAMNAEGDDRLFRSPLRVYQLLIELTEVSRRHGGHTSPFSAFTPYPGRFAGSRWVQGLAAHHVRRWARDRGFPAGQSAGEAGVAAVSVRRLRQTVIEQRRRPVAHTRRTMNDHYLMRSGTVREDSRRVVGAALREQVDTARAAGAVAVFTTAFLARARQDPGVAGEVGLQPQTLTRLMAGEQDTPLASCTDHLHGPHTEPGTPCTASFLACLDCQNARALPHQLPAQIAAADRIGRLRPNVDPSLWTTRYQPRLAQLADILAAYTPAERDQARTQITTHQQRLVDELLDGKWDLR